MNLSIIILIIGISSCYADTSASVHIVGRFLCRGRPQQYAEVKIAYKEVENYDIAHVFSDAGGFFKALAYDDTPHHHLRLWIYHTCWVNADEPQKCSRLFKVNIPKVFMTAGGLPTKIWNMGEIELEKWKHDEEYSPCGK